MLDKVKLETLLNNLIDDRCDLFGIRNTISYLFYQGFTKEELEELNFEDYDIEYVLDNPDEEYDGI